MRTKGEKNKLTAQKVFVITSMGRVCFELVDHSKRYYQHTEAEFLRNEMNLQPMQGDH